MENLVKKDTVVQDNLLHSENLLHSDSPNNKTCEQQPQNQQQKTKRKHRRGKPKAKNANKPYKKSNWKFQVPRPNFNGGGGGMNNRNGARPKILRSRSLVPYNTNKFLMEEHLAEVPSALLTPSGRTRDSSFSVDSEDNYFFSLPEDEEEFLTKEFANVYEKARVERLENLTKQQLIEECLQIEDRYSSDQGRQQQRISSEFMSKIRILEEKVRELSRENYNLRCQLMRSAAMAVAASPPSAAPPIGAACEPTPMDSSSVDSESDSSSSSSSSSSNGSADIERPNNLRQRRQRRSCSSGSSLSDYRAFKENQQMESDEDDKIVTSPNVNVVTEGSSENKTAELPTEFVCEGRQSLESSSFEECIASPNDGIASLDAAMEDEFPSFSPLLGGVDTSPSCEMAISAAFRTQSHTKGAEDAGSAEQNYN
ncbi:uncharacterized protein LOC101448545 [Ceratitis capitata]|uniref:uncharacterized protein LOC101448545 n=1 Tax=Ceratitis capitata TaxID=7213 RepID=UPI000329FC83|nr:uncharacterized protein LOC101448545 [Ceratitis capitata]